MTGAFVGAGAAIGAGVVAWLYRGARQQRILKDRLLARPIEVVAPVTEEETPQHKNWLVRYRKLAWLVGAVVFSVLFWLVALPAAFASSLAVMAGVIAHLIEDRRALRRTILIETQLAEAIDLMVASLSAGAGVMEALDSAADEVKEPLRDELQQLVGQIRIGEEPKSVFAELAERIPLENFRLFAFTLAVHGESGGSLAPTLSTVGEAIRDRIELGRMARSQSAQSQASVIGILAITWFLGAMMWRAAPERFEEFLTAPFGALLTSGAMMMQAVGLVWISKLAKLRF